MTEVVSRTPQLDRIAEVGTWTAIRAAARPSDVEFPDNSIVCVDGFKLSVIAGAGAYCSPRPSLHDGDVPVDFAGPFSQVEVGYPSERPEPWSEWERYCESPGSPTDTVYGYVPVKLVRALIESHGGEKP